MTDPDRPAVDVVVCVHDALEDARRCLASLIRQTPGRRRLILVDDGSAPATRDALTDVARAEPRCTLIRNDQRRGYTTAANQGLRAATGEVVVLLNSDTIVTPRWLERLLECAASDPTIGIVGPLSNAAGYQSVPRRFDADGEWARNPLPPGWSPDQVAETIAAISRRAFPRVGLVNGFCFVITRAVIEAIGYFDEAGFPDGYGEEIDYCLQAADAGFGLAIADHAYVYHAKSRSYSPRQIARLKRAGSRVLFRKHGEERIAAAVATLDDEPTLAAIRRDLHWYLEETSPPALSPAAAIPTT